MGRQKMVVLWLSFGFHLTPTKKGIPQKRQLIWVEADFLWYQDPSLASFDHGRSNPIQRPALFVPSPGTRMVPDHSLDRRPGPFRAGPED